jgi:dTDP-4-dehydrorhamnose reductase
MEITTADYPTPAKRPHNSRLSGEKLKRDFGFQMRPWQAMVEDCVTALLQAEG